MENRHRKNKNDDMDMAYDIPELYEIPHTRVQGPITWDLADYGSSQFKDELPPWAVEASKTSTSPAVVSRDPSPLRAVFDEGEEGVEAVDVEDHSERTPGERDNEAIGSSFTSRQDREVSDGIEASRKRKSRSADIDVSNGKRAMRSSSISKQELDRTLLPKLQSPNPLPVAVDTVKFFEELIPALDSPVTPSPLRDHLEILKAVPHEMTVFKAVLKLADPLVRAYHKRVWARKEQLSHFNDEYARGGLKLGKMAQLSAELAIEHENYASGMLERWEALMMRGEVSRS